MLFLDLDVLSLKTFLLVLQKQVGNMDWMKLENTDADLQNKPVAVSFAETYMGTHQAMLDLMLNIHVQILELCLSLLNLDVMIFCGN